MILFFSIKLNIFIIYLTKLEHQLLKESPFVYKKDWKFLSMALNTSMILHYINQLLVL